MRARGGDRRAKAERGRKKLHRSIAAEKEQHDKEEVLLHMAGKLSKKNSKSKSRTHVKHATESNCNMLKLAVTKRDTEGDDAKEEKNSTQNTLNINEPVGTQQSTELTGLQKWLAIYHAKRPGLQVLQQQIDNFIADYEATEEKARREKEAAAADEGWTVVTHQKGRKKTKDSETGVTVGAVAPSVAERSAKKMKETPTDFYRFQQRETRRNEVLQLQRRFEEDKKRIAKLKTARKFRPY